MEKTDLKKILSVSGQSGLFRFVAHAKAGVIAESFITGKRSMLSINDRVTSMSDISIYTDSDEVSLKELFTKMKEHLGEADAPESKSSPDTLKNFFATVLPDYDRDRFYISHMKKVVEWYNQLKKYASLEFEEEEKAENTENTDSTGDMGNAAGEKKENAE